MTQSTEKIRENRLRRMAERQGFRLHKSRRRDPRAWDYGTYCLVDPRYDVLVTREAESLEGIETYLRGPMEIRVQRDPLEDVTFGDDERPIASWVASPGRWHLHLAWDDDGYNLGGRADDSDEAVRETARICLGWATR